MLVFAWYLTGVLLHFVCPEMVDFLSLVPVGKTICDALEKEAKMHGSAT